jgi:hypothetical protein
MPAIFKGFRLVFSISIMALTVLTASAVDPSTTAQDKSNSINSEKSENAKNLNSSSYFSIRVKSEVLQQHVSATQLQKGTDAETEDEIIREYAQKIADSLPYKIYKIRTDISLQLQVKKRGSEIIIQAESDLPYRGTEATADFVFSIINGNDANQDGKISLGGELSGSTFIQTAGDAIRLAQGDDSVTPTEALQAIFEKAGLFPTADISICYQPQ